MLTLGALLTRDTILPGSCWQLEISVNGFVTSASNELATQAVAGRSFEILSFEKVIEASTGSQDASVFQARFLEDGYSCWLISSDVIGRARNRGEWKPNLLNFSQIQSRIPEVMSWVEKAASRPNQYLWGGTVGPDFDCSGLVQSAFASQGIWLPRDAYQQESFAKAIPADIANVEQLFLGDLLFFGTPQKCTHVALHKGSGLYWHSSSSSNGRNGIGCDGLLSSYTNRVSSNYRAQFRGAGRICSCHDGTTLP